MKKTDRIGVVALVFMLAVAIALTAALIIWTTATKKAHEEYLECITSIPGYLDPQETAYLLEECEIGLPVPE